MRVIVVLKEGKDAEKKEISLPTFLKLTPSFYHNLNPTL